MLDPQTVIRRRPHFSAQAGNITFLNSKRPMSGISEAAYAVFADLSVPMKMIDLPDDADGLINELAQQGLIDVIAPVATAGRTSILVIEPHCDDAALSIGALMWDRRNDAAFSLITLASRSNYTSSFHTGRDFFNRDEVSELRRLEGEIFMQHLGGKYDVAGCNEATMRYEDADWSEPFFQAHRSCVAINNDRRAAASTLEEWTAKVVEILRSSDAEEIWFPLGAGTHSDHDLTRNACLGALMQMPELMARKKIYLYKDVPYGIDCQDHTDRLLRDLTAVGAQIVDAHVDVTDTYAKKLELLEIFASQFKVKFVEPGVKRSAAYGAAEGRKMEHMWQLVACPTALETAKLFIQSPDAVEITPQVNAWVRGGDTVSRVRVLALGASGNWAEDEAMLRSKFPNAKITVYATSATESEISLRKSDNVDLQRVDQGAVSWGLLALKLAVSPSARTLFIAGDRQNQAKSLSRLWLFGKSLVVPTSGTVTLALSGDI